MPDPTTVITIEAGSILGVLGQEPGALPPDAVAAIAAPPEVTQIDVEGVPLAHVCRNAVPPGWQIVAIACSGRHPGHPRLRPLFDRLRALDPSFRMGACDRCDGSGWVRRGANAARSTIVAALACGMWRGIPIPPMSGLTADRFHAILGLFLEPDGPPTITSGSDPGAPDSGAPGLSPFPRSNGSPPGEPSTQGEPT